MSKNNVKEGKYEPFLIYQSLLEGISASRKYGIEKYGSPNDWWTTEPIEHLNAAIRHIRAYAGGEVLDSKSNVHHLAAAAANIMFELERYAKGGARIQQLEPADTIPYAVGIAHERIVVAVDKWNEETNQLERKPDGEVILPPKGAKM